jgi:hypothetical protein
MLPLSIDKCVEYLVTLYINEAFLVGVSNEEKSAYLNCVLRTTASYSIQ